MEPPPLRRQNAFHSDDPLPDAMLDDFYKSLTQLGAAQTVTPAQASFSPSSSPSSSSSLDSRFGSTTVSPIA